MKQTHFIFCDTEVIACPSGALMLPAPETLVVSDLHLEKGSRWARRGRLLPPYDSRATLAALAADISEHAPRQVVCLGDSFDDGGGGSRLDADDAACLRALMSEREWIWIAGNHDPLPPGLRGWCMNEIAIGPLVLRHQARAGAVAGELSGHYHPKAKVAIAGRSFSGRCFVCDGRRLILPAFGAYAGGLDVFDPALTALIGRDFVAHLIGRSQIHAVPARRLIGAWKPVSPPRTRAAPASPS